MHVGAGGTIGFILMGSFNEKYFFSSGVVSWNGLSARTEEKLELQFIKMENKSVINDGENKYRHDWYQTDSHVVVTLFIKNVNKDKLKITFEEKEIETKSTKKEFIRWESLERSPKEEKHEVKAEPKPAPSDLMILYQYYLLFYLGIVEI
ncbi:hypothetical protein Anas_06318 [Armadillidium nasatum]|uniref:CS domain-containing protein n=1 Tax=Armadillidium nasatum TaxID=96803 RepID=A0A5N5TAC9_9CRUS|nr:hypothetical protein Anas_06318 [Armadillidium nasatum]